ncbi:MmcQ/YjbR family DNA-binding protein [Aurantivibrio plasticivorans]
MKYSEVMTYCLSFPETKRQALSAEGNAFALLAQSSPFGYFETGAPIQWRFSLRVTESHFNDLANPPLVRKAGDKGKEGQHDYWITIQRVENFSETLLKELIQWSYQRALEHKVTH